jgi:hypothetical protein
MLVDTQLLPSLRSPTCFCSCCTWFQLTFRSLMPFPLGRCPLHDFASSDLGDGKSFHDCQGDGCVIDRGPVGLINPEIITRGYVVQMMRNDIQLVEVESWKTFARHRIPLRLCELDADLSLSFSPFFIQHLTKLISISD